MSNVYQDKAAIRPRFPLFELCVISALLIILGTVLLAKAIALPSMPVPLPSRGGCAIERAYARLEVSP
jgi:hypothetical protein